MSLNLFLKPNKKNTIRVYSKYLPWIYYKTVKNTDV